MENSAGNKTDKASINTDRREILRSILIGTSAVATAGTFMSIEEKVLAEKMVAETKDVDALSGASRIHTNWGKLSDLKKKVPSAKIKDVKISRLIMGGNLVGGWAHARDLLYASDLVKAYHTRDKIIATLKMGEACGINTYLGHHSHIGIMVDYWEKADGTIQYIADCNSIDGALNAIEKGAVAAYIQGEKNDSLVREEKYDEIATFLERVRKEDVPVGLGAHRLSTIQKCVEKGLIPDFWMKTIHHDNYWSRHADKPEKDNVYCREPAETIEFMNSRTEPWIGFKTLAAGAIKPADGFRFALEGGADFLCVGMYDFQIVDDVNIFNGILDSEIKRSRPWRA